MIYRYRPTVVTFELNGILPLKEVYMYVYFDNDLNTGKQFYNKLQEQNLSKNKHRTYHISYNMFSCTKVLNTVTCSLQGIQHRVVNRVGFGLRNSDIFRAGSGSGSAISVTQNSIYFTVKQILNNSHR